MRRAAITVLILIAIGAAGAACSGGGSDAPNPTSTTNFEQLRNSLSSQLDSIGPNIGFMPDDVLNQILNNCHELEKFVDEERVSNLCDAIQRARDTSDPGLIDQIVAQLAQLQPR